MNEISLKPAFTENNIPVVITASNQYAPYAGVFIQSLINHAADNNNYDIIVLEREISDSNKSLLKLLINEHSNISIRFHNPSVFFESLDPDIFRDSAYPAEVYCKILAPFFLREQYPRILVMDIDTLLMHDIADLMEYDLGENSFAAAKDTIMEGFYNSNYVFPTKKQAVRPYCDEVLGLKNPLSYVNSGVLVFDTERYCNEHDMSEILACANSRSFVIQDQDVLNILFEGRVTSLDPAWNAVVSVNARMLEYGFKCASEESQQALMKALEKPYLLHWAGKPKPWICPDVPHGHEWWKVAMQTPFMGHILARMMVGLNDRQEHYIKKYGATVPAWDPMPKGIDRSFR